MSNETITINSLREKLDSSIRKAEYSKAFSEILKLFIAMKEANINERTQIIETVKQKILELETKYDSYISSMSSEMEKISKNTISNRDSAIKSIEKKAMDYCRTEMDRMENEQRDNLNYIYDKVSNLKNGVDGKTPTKQEIESIIKPLISQPIEIPKPKVEDIEGLDKFVRERIPQKSISGMRKIPIIKRVNLTDQVDGATKTFYLPKDTVAVLGVWGTQFPITFDDADFNLVGNTLVLTSEVSAPASGQTLMALVETLFYD